MTQSLAGSSQGTRHQVLQQGQLSVEEVAHTRHHHYGQALRPRPVERGGERHHVVCFAVDHEGVRRHRRHLEIRCRGADQDQVLDVFMPELPGRVRGHIAPERESAEGQGFRIPTVMSHHCEHVVDLAPTLVPLALRGADATEVESHRAPAPLQEGARDGLHDLVVHRAAVLRVGMRDHGQSAWGRGLAGGRIDRAFEQAGRARDGLALRVGVHWKARNQRPMSGGSSRRSTTLPFFRCDSTISSMSSLST